MAHEKNSDIFESVVADHPFVHTLEPRFDVKGNAKAVRYNKNRAWDQSNYHVHKLLQGLRGKGVSFCDDGIKAFVIKNVAIRAGLKMLDVIG